jgi:hypothetical protein
MEEIKAGDLSLLLGGRMGLIIGPAITKYPGCFTELNERLAARRDISPEEHYLKTGDALLDKGATCEEVREWIREVVGEQKQSSLLTHITKFRWGAVLSAALDAHFEDVFEREASRRGTWQPVTVLSNLMTPPPPRTIPVFKLLGVASRDSFAYSTVSYLDRRATWRHAVRGFADLVKGNPVLCLGMADCPWTLVELITEMIGEQSAMPGTLLLLADDPIRSNTLVNQRLLNRAKVLTIRGTAGDVARAAAAAEKTGFARPLPMGDDQEDPLAALRRFEDVSTTVNDHLEPRIAKGERHQLRDLLFSPSVPRWDPFIYDLDFKRTLTDQLLARLKDLMADKNTDSVACILTGGAVTGKTMLLKRIALELAKSGELVLWLKPSSYQDGSRVMRHLLQKVSAIEEWRGKRIAFIMDDPLGFGSLSPKDLALAAKAADVRMLLVAGVRTSEWASWDQNDLAGGLHVIVQEELPDALDNDEWKRLPDYLVALSAAPDRTAAENALLGVKNRSAQDTLSMLYWLLPETRAGIAGSIRDEYHRLGDVAGLTKVILGTVNRGTTTLKSAYEMVAVADHYRASLPVEVLVSALGIPYHEWIDATRPDSAAWGLFYSEESNDRQTILYRTRNSIVTRMIVEAINGGTLGHSGELRVMSQLLRACTGRTSPVYREFCVRALVPHEKLERLEYEDGLQLYDDAIAALPHPDKTLVHHKGLWVKNKGQNAALATEILEQALATPVYPYAQRNEVDGHIHTSIAAAVLDGINQLTQNVEDGKGKILDHLAKARSADFFNPRAVHVQANLISHLADKVPMTHRPDYFSLLNQAVADVDHTLLLLQSPVMQSTYVVDDVRMLEQIRDQVLLKVQSIDDLKREAERVWAEFQSQQGFVLATRKMYAVAQAKNKKFDAPFYYCYNAIEKVKEAGLTPVPALYAAAVQVYYHWQVRRQVFSGTIPIRWDEMRDFSAKVISSSQYAQDPLHKHIYALSLAHLGSWVEANALYTQMRQSNMPAHVLWTPRDFLLHETGGLRTVQGVMRSAANREFLYVEDLKTDFHVDRKERWPREGEITHATIQFSFAGPTAVHSR